DRPDHRRADRAPDRDEGPAARLSKGHAGGQAGRDGGVCRAVACDPRHDRHGARSRARRSANEGRRGRRLRHRDRSRRLAGADLEAAVPRCPSRHGADRGARLKRRRGAARIALEGDAGNRAEDIGRGAEGAFGGRLGEKPHQLRRHRAEECAGAGESLGEAAGKTAKVGLSAPISLQFHDALGLATLYGAARFGDIDVIRELRPTTSGWAIILLSVAALTLAGCGRKGPLDPPTSSTNAPLASAPAATDTEAENAAKPSVFNSTYGTDAPPVAPKGVKRSFVLDPLLGN